MTKTIQRQTLKTITLAGTYTGGQAGTYSGCGNSGSNGSYKDNFDVQVTQFDNGSATFQFAYTSGLSCAMSGTLAQYGPLVTATRPPDASVIFASFDPHMRSLEEYLGPSMLFYFDRVFDGRELRVLGRTEDGGRHVRDQGDGARHRRPVRGALGRWRLSGRRELLRGIPLSVRKRGFRWLSGFSAPPSADERTRTGRLPQLRQH